MNVIIENAPYIPIHEFNSECFYVRFLSVRDILNPKKLFRD